MPMWTRSLMRFRSSSATAPRTVNIILPIGVEVSMLSERNEINPKVTKLFKYSQEVRYRTGEPIKPRHNHNIEPSSASILHQPLPGEF
jgi:hypothetical protein